MKKSLNEEKLKELNFLYKLFLAISRFHYEPSFYKISKESADKLYKRKDSISIRGFKAGLNDFCEMIDIYDINKRQELNIILQKELGISLEQVEKKQWDNHLKNSENSGDTDEF